MSEQGGAQNGRGKGPEVRVCPECLRGARGDLVRGDVQEQRSGAARRLCPSLREVRSQGRDVLREVIIAQMTELSVQGGPGGSCFDDRVLVKEDAMKQ